MASEDKNPNVVYYKLFATTAHIRDPKTGGNLVSNVHVGKKYHQRKERVTCTQWYLFNDFSITPLDKKVTALVLVEFIHHHIILIQLQPYLTIIVGELYAFFAKYM